MKAGITIIDADGHVSDRPSMYRQYLQPPHNARGERDIYPGDGFDRGRGATRGGRSPQSVEDMLADMDVEGIDTMVAFPTIGLNLGMLREADYAAAAARAYNDWVSDFRRSSGDRIQAVAILPSRTCRRRFASSSEQRRSWACAALWCTPKCPGRTSATKRTGPCTRPPSGSICRSASTPTAAAPRTAIGGETSWAPTPGPTCRSS